MLLMKNELLICDLPRDCIMECSRPGPADEAVAFWRRELEFTVDRGKAVGGPDSPGRALAIPGRFLMRQCIEPKGR